MNVTYQNGWAVPEGWKLVPVEPTPQMEMAARNHHSLTTHYEDHRISIWRAMLDAAPTPPAQTEQQPVAPEDYKIPCDVMLPPATRIKRGCSLNTLMVAMAQREILPPAQRVFAAAPALPAAQNHGEVQKLRGALCSEERPCIPCFTDNGECSASLHAMAAQKEDDALDAARYRWLRDNCHWDVMHRDLALLIEEAQADDCEDLDGIIDAAMQRTSGGDHD